MHRTQHGAQLWQYLKDNGITQAEAAHKMGYTVNYLNNILNGNMPLTRSAKMAFIQTYPKTAAFLLPQLTCPTQESAQ